jgi:hypothetical protein
MGCCKSTAKAAAFRQSELDAPLLSTILPKLSSAENQVLIVRLRCMRNLPIGNTLTTLTDSFAEMRLEPYDDQLKTQRQESSLKPGSLNPLWVCATHLLFVCVNTISRYVLTISIHPLCYSTGASREISICCQEQSTI